MKISSLRGLGSLGAGLLVALTLAACERQEAARTAAEPPAADETMTTPDATTSQDQMTAPSSAPSGMEGQTQSGTGTVTSVDAASGRISIQHESIANMAAGTTEFEVENREALNQLSNGQQVEFSFTQQAGAQPRITQISPTAQSPQATPQPGEQQPSPQPTQ